ncbi:hypothetical protein Q4Q35_16590 [Flavivirga aquimarina]|uniref:Uncharacterized protein n=1 Tax=Flavivirga aquimarina TaxID=2027862 RepID=A0ABT8WEJ3_9FLAO|nr:hypothetical protein [Flavivirga aquimarina]MDO5971426.1 hypothetical protein [Flavivirga aquimarina]
MKSLIFKLVVFFFCLPSGGILLLKSFGYSQMYHSVYLLFIPSIILLLGVLLFSYFKSKEVFKLILVGAIGGLIGTFGYDLIRVPFMLMGSRIFAPINMYGVWLTDATIGNAYTDTIGWIYHFSNGITFGIMYALFMRGRSFWWAIAYALLLETIFVVSPFGALFGLTSKPLSLVAAYIGHVAYGYPLGKLVQNFDVTITNLKFFKKGLLRFTGVLCISVIVLTVYTNSNAVYDSQIVISNDQLNPHIIRINSGDSIPIKNKRTGSNATVIIGDEVLKLLPNQDLIKQISKPGIHQVRLKNDQTIKSIFILSEPVEKFNQ